VMMHTTKPGAHGSASCACQCSGIDDRSHLSQVKLKKNGDELPLDDDAWVKVYQDAAASAEVGADMRNCEMLQELRFVPSAAEQALSIPAPLCCRSATCGQAAHMPLRWWSSPCRRLSTARSPRSSPRQRRASPQCRRRLSCPSLHAWSAVPETS
jgi:hypothetical protein